jgi:hypothetical protein
MFMFLCHAVTKQLHEGDPSWKLLMRKIIMNLPHFVERDILSLSSNEPKYFSLN